eukprot:7886860-Prorocentrum_lima.AAC.1
MDVQQLPLDDWGANAHEHCQNLQDGIRDLMHKHFKTSVKRKVKTFLTDATWSLICRKSHLLTEMRQTRRDYFAALLPC